MKCKLFLRIICVLLIVSEVTIVGCRETSTVDESSVSKESTEFSMHTEEETTVGGELEILPLDGNRKISGSHGQPFSDEEIKLIIEDELFISSMKYHLGETYEISSLKVYSIDLEKYELNYEQCIIPVMKDGDVVGYLELVRHNGNIYSELAIDRRGVEPRYVPLFDSLINSAPGEEYILTNYFGYLYLIDSKNVIHTLFGPSADEAFTITNGEKLFENLYSEQAVLSAERIKAG